MEGLWPEAGLLGNAKLVAPTSRYLYGVPTRPATGCEPPQLSARQGHDGQVRGSANASSQSRLVPQIAVERPGMSRELATVQQDAAWAHQPPDRPTPGSTRLS
jgi:hypothetical protein